MAITADESRATTAPADAVQQLRTAFVVLMRAEQLLTVHNVLPDAGELAEAVEQIRAAQNLIRGVGETVKRRINL